MRIALVSHEYPPFSGGGIGTYATLMARCFAQAGHETHLITNRFDLGLENPEHRLEELRQGNLWVHRVPAWDDALWPAGPHAAKECPLGRVGRDFSPYLYYSEKIAEHIELLHARFNFDIAEFPECAAEGYGVLRRQRSGLGLRNLATTVCCHSPIDEIYQYNLYSRHDAGFWRRKTLEDNSIRWSHAVHSPSALMGRIVAERLGLSDDARPWDVLPLPMDFTEIPEPEAYSETGPPTLFFVGRLEPRKGVRYLIDAAVRLMEDRHPDLQVELVGRDCHAGEVAGGMKDFLLSRIPQGFRENFVFPGHVPREELFSRYRVSTACVFAPEWDNFPYTCIEAMASGACVVGSDYSGIAEMVRDGESGILFRAGDVESLTESIRRAIEDRELNQRIRHAAASRIRSMCDPHQAVTSRVAHYQRAIAHAEQHRPRRAPSQRRTQLLQTLVYVPEDSSNPTKDLQSTIDALRNGAEAARFSLGCCIAIRDPARLSPEFDSASVSVVETARAGLSAARAAWAQRVNPLEGDAMLTLRAGETLTPNALRIWRRRLESESELGWVSSWAVPAESARPLKGNLLVDFEPPLALIDNAWMPPALLRTAAARDVGFWDTTMPEDWSDWALCLTLHEAGWRGEILPRWLISALSREIGEAVSDSARAIYLQRIMNRCPGAFTAHGKDLWVYDLLGIHSSFAAAH